MCPGKQKCEKKGRIPFEMFVEPNICLKTHIQHQNDNHYFEFPYNATNIKIILQIKTFLCP